jgi:excisionase family DNA binding protein
MKTEVSEQPRLLYPVDDACYVLGVQRTTFYGLIRDGEIKAVKVGRRTLVAHAELEQFVERLIAKAANATNAGPDSRRSSKSDHGSDVPRV